MSEDKHGEDTASLAATIQKHSVRRRAGIFVLLAGLAGTFHFIAGVLADSEQSETKVVSKASASEHQKPPLQKKTNKKEATAHSPTGCFAYVNPHSPTGQVQDTEANTSESLPTPERGEAWRVLERFFHHERSSEPASVGLRVGIVLAADPIHTNLGLMFDRQISTIEQAAQDGGYDFDSGWMPWKHEELDSLGSLDDREALREITEGRESCPGVLLFRHRGALIKGSEATDGEYASGLLLFVVGEQPTGGIDPHQWDNALSEMKSGLVEFAQHVSNQKKLLVLGPNFSGSLPSLQREIEAHLSDYPHVLVLSGTTSNYGEVNAFRSALKKLNDTLPSSSLNFGTFAEADEIHIARYLQYLDNVGGNRREVAILSEDETGYSASWNEYDDCPLNHARDRGVTPRGSEDNGTANQQKDCPLNLHYPRDISSMREAYQKQSIFDSTFGGGRSFRTILRNESPEESNGMLDTVPTYGGAVGAFDEEAKLFGLVDALRSHHIRHLILRSTNPLDLLFLARFFHRAYPEARVTTMGTDLLFRREIDTTEFRGMTSLSNFPLLPREQDWKRGKHSDEHPVFSGNLVEGNYFAARYLIENRELSSLPDNSGTPSLVFTELSRLPNYLDPRWSEFSKESAVPATWLTVVGRNGYWPLAVLSDLRPSAALVRMRSKEMKEADRRLPSSVPLSFKICFCLAIMLVIYQISGEMPHSFYSADGMFAVFRTEGRGRSQPIMRGMNAALSVMPLVQLSLLALVYMRNWLWSLFELILAMVLISFLWFQIRRRRNFPENRVELLAAYSKDEVSPPVRLEVYRLGSLRHAARRRAADAYLASVLCFATIFWVATGWWYSTDFAQLYRMVHLTDGVSPLAPVLILTLGFYLWSWQAMAGNLLLGRVKPVLPKFNGHELPSSGAVEAQMPQIKHFWSRLDFRYFRLSEGLGQRIHDEADPINGLFMRRRWRDETAADRLRRKYGAFGPGILALIAFFWCLGGLEPVTLDGRLYGGSLLFFAWFAALLCWAGCLQLHGTWMQLRRLLHALLRTPLRQAVQKLIPVSTTSLWDASGEAHRVQYRLFLQQYEAVRRLIEVHGWDDAKLRLAEERGLGISFRTRATLHGSNRFWGAQFTDDMLSIRRLYAEVATLIMNVLQREVWSDEPLSFFRRDKLRSNRRTKHEKHSGVADQHSQEVIDTLEEFACAYYTAFIHNVLSRMRTITMGIAMLFAALCFSFAFYPFSPRTYIASVLILNFLLIGAVVARVYAGMARNDWLTLISDDEKSKLGGEFWLKITGFTVAPMIGIIATQYPAFFEWVLNCLGPGIGVAK